MFVRHTAAPREINNQINNSATAATTAIIESVASKMYIHAP